MKKLFLSLCLFSFLSVGTMPLSAQSASLVGSVKDAQDAVIANAKVTLKSLDTGVEKSVNADSTGNYEFAAVRPGTYSVKVEQPGFKSFQQSQVTLAVQDRVRVDVSLQVGETTTVVTIEALPTAVQTDSSTLGDVVDNKKIVEIPLNGRFFLDLALLTAGTVVPSTNNRTFLAVPSGIGISGINASGTREDSTN